MPRPSLTGKIVLLALAYWASGQLALLLAIPPGFTTAIFPPLGISLACVLLWGRPLVVGALLGSTLLNLSITWSQTGTLTLPGLAIALGIACASSAQCLLAHWLIHRWVGFPNPLTDERSIFRLLLLGGPLSCLLSAAGGNLVLLQAGLLEWQNLPYNFWTWWVGDSIGVLIATPLTLIAFARPRALWRSRISSVALPLLISSLLMVALFFKVSAASEQEQEHRFHEQAKLISATLEFRILRYAEAVSAIESLYAASDEVSRQDFRQFTTEILHNYPGVQALEWAPVVEHAARAEYERALAREIPDSHGIRERDPQGQPIPAAERDRYVPVHFIEPMQSNLQALGFDLHSEALRRATLAQTAQSGELAMSPPIQLIQDNLRQPGFLLIHAVKRNGQLQGFVLAVVRVTDLIDHALESYPRPSFHLRLDDRSGATSKALFHEGSSDLPAYTRGMIWEQMINLGGRQLHLQIAPSASFLQSSQNMQPWLVLAGGLLLCALLGGFLLSMSGRTELIRSEVQRRTEELSAILEHAAEAIVLFNAEGQVERANPAAQQLFAAPGQSLAGRHIGALLPALAGSLGLPAAPLGRSIEMPGVDWQGHPLELELSLSQYLIGDHCRYICLIRDIRERKQVERLKNEFIATVNHELRTPLTSIKGSLGLLAGGAIAGIPEQAKQLIELASQNSDRLGALVNDILDIEKLEFGQTKLSLAPHELSPQLEQARRQNQGYADHHGVHLELHTDALPPGCRVAIDPLRLQQVLSNLISNAVKFSPPGETVKICARVEDNTARIEVLDKGPGIPPEFQSRMFQKFAQADGSNRRQQGGTGLGLSICKNLIERMQGDIGFSSSAQGSCFYFCLPLV